MPIRRYLPSAKLVSIVLSLALSVGLVYAADSITHPATPAVSIAVVTGAQPNSNINWEAALDAIQAQNASSTIPAPDPNLVNELLQSVQSPNLTDSVGKSILISLTNAKSQGLGDDVPTQNQIVASAAAQIQSQLATPSSYTTADLTIVPSSDSSLRAYGNGVMSVLSATSSASEEATFIVLDMIVEGHDASQSNQLAVIGAAYATLAEELAQVPVPQTLVPFDIEAINNLLALSATYTDMEAIASDPVRGLVGLKNYESYMDDGAQVFTDIARELNKDGILFSKDEPGSAWSIFLAPTASPATQ